MMATEWPSDLPLAGRMAAKRLTCRERRAIDDWLAENEPTPCPVYDTRFSMRNIPYSGPQKCPRGPSPGPRANRRHIAAERRAKVLDLALRGMSADEIAKEIGCERKRVAFDMDWLRDQGNPIPFGRGRRYRRRG